MRITSYCVDCKQLNEIDLETEGCPTCLNDGDRAMLLVTIEADGQETLEIFRTQPESFEALADSLTVTPEQRYQVSMPMHQFRRYVDAVRSEIHQR